uniref:Uncharacterized protein n=1 Tax=Anopheles atroparvus TaxID=41427 RepID=A0A182IKH9_ANOAO
MATMASSTHAVELLVAFLALTGTTPTVWATCTASISADRITACAFNPLLALAERSGWVLSKENCGEIVGPEAFEVPPVLYFEHAEPDHLYTVLFVEERDPSGSPDGRRFYLQWLVANVPESAFVSGMTYMDGDTVMDYLSPAPRSADDGDADGQPTRYGFYIFEQVYGTIYPPMPNTREYFDLDGWIGAIYPEAALCGPVASIGFSAQ